MRTLLKRRRKKSEGGREGWGGEASSSSSSAQGCGNKKAPIFFSPFFPSSSPRNGTTHGGVPPEGKLRHLLAVWGEWEEGKRLCTTRRRLVSLFFSLSGQEVKKKEKVPSKRARVVRRDTEEPATMMAALLLPLACACHPGLWRRRNGTAPPTVAGCSSEGWRSPLANRSPREGEGAEGGGRGRWWWWRGQRDLWSSSSGIPTLGCTPSSSAAEWCPSRRQTQTGCSLCLLHM